MPFISRRESLMRLSALTGLPLFSRLRMKDENLQTRPIPSTGEVLPVIGLGTWQTFDVNQDSSEQAELTSVLKTMYERGGRVIDSSPMYGHSERVVGDLTTAAGLNDKFFIATKVWTSGRESGIRQMNESFALLKRKTMDLMQIHNLVDWQTHLKTLRAWKEEGRVRYIGITHYTSSAYSSLEQIMKEHPIDFLQINYSLQSREAEKRLFPLAQEKKIPVLINRPFEEGDLFQRVKGKELPTWASEFDCNSWGQFFLKYIISHPAVTCVIPGTSKVNHMLDNLGAGMGKLPNEEQRRKMISLIE